MKRKFYLLLLILFVSLTRCQKDNVVPQELERSSSVDLNILADVQQWHTKTINEFRGGLNQAGPTVSGTKRKIKMLEPQWETARAETLFNGAKVVVVSSEQYELQDKSIKMLRAFVFLLSAKGNKIMNGKIVEFIGDADFITKNPKVLITRYQNDAIIGYNGSVMTYDVNYRFLGGRAFENGTYVGQATHELGSANKAKSVSESIFQYSGKKASPIPTVKDECFYVFHVWTYPNGQKKYTFMYSYCIDEHTGGGGGGGQNPPGGGGTVSPGGDFGNFPEYPIDGQTYVYTYPNNSQVTFTFHSEFNAWLLPGIEAIFQSGNTITVENNPAPNFNGAVLSALLLPAIVDPTQATKLIFVGAAVVITAVYVYQYIDYIAQTFSDARDREFCIMLGVKCFMTTPQYDCATCEQNCISQAGAWPNQTCPIF